MRPISEFLTPLPVTVACDEIMSQVRKLMEEKHIRHLPVMHRNELVGVITERDLYLVMGLDLDWRREPARRAMAPDPLRVSIDADASEVCEAMRQSRHDCALVENADGKLVGIFTESDAVKAMATLLSE